MLLRRVEWITLMLSPSFKEMMTTPRSQRVDGLPDSYRVEDQSDICRLAADSPCYQRDGAIYGLTQSLKGLGQGLDVE